MVANRANALANNDRQIIHLVEKQVHQELIHRVYARTTYPPRTRIIKQLSSSPILWNDSSRPLPKITMHPIKEKLELLLRRRSAHFESNSKSSGEVKKKPFFFIRPKAERTNAQQTDMSKPKPEDKCFLCGKAGHWKKDCPNPRNLSSYVLSINPLPMLKKKSSQNVF